jgi:outer membrane protein
MKNVILTVAAVFAFGFANAQDKKESTGEGFAKGDVFVSGSVGFASEKTGEFKTNGFDFSPKAAYFVSENIAVGISLGIKSVKISEGSDDAKNSTMSAGAFARYYTTPASKFSFFGQLGFNYNSYDSEYYVDNSGNLALGDSKGNGFDVMLSPGVNYFVSNNFALEASFGALGYETTKPDYSGAEATNTFGLNVDMSTIKLGLVYKF